ncbi:U-box domain-containing protein 7 isoform X2 [Argentina anserina]|uniref:U-box domain-containing protein 7 isoform X2 n=1 Tax=Argentina anserina TaxID=57926 RepID=UPI00217630E1|nr:U-box domain-containing protein 7 isoform X2 [Potentilla anserina]
MAKCHRNNVGSVVLDRPTTTSSSGHSSRIWSSFSAASFRRLIFDAVSCGASSRYRHRDQTDAALPPPASPPARSTVNPSKQVKQLEKPKPKSEKLSDLLNMAAEWSEAESDAVTKKKVEALEELKSAARELQVVEKRREAASEVRLLAKEDSEARVTLAMLGVIPPLVGMLDESDDVEAQIASLYALLNLGIGNDVNKAAILQAGAIPFLLKTLKNLDNTISRQAKQDALRALYNLSIYSSNVSYILETDMIPFFFNVLGDMEMSERILAILSNMVSTPEGRKAISSVRDAFPALVDALNWNDSPGCQEKASYILMVMAHKAFGDRQAMIEAGVVSALLELTLLGSTLAQKRASRILECFRVDKGKQISQNFGGSSAVSAPICGSSSSSSNPNLGSKECLVEDENMMSDERKAVKQLVQQSLQSNMRRIVKRANLPQDFVPSDHFKSLTLSSTSKSLPF